MKKNKKYINILIKKKIQELLKENEIKASKEIINEIDKYTKKIIQEFLDNIIYQLQLEGRKVIKKKDINKGIQTLKKEEDFEV